MKIKLVFINFIFYLFAFKSADDKVTIWLIGDSTIAEKLTTKYPETGWGMPFQNYFDLFSPIISE